MSKQLQGKKTSGGWGCFYRFHPDSWSPAIDVLIFVPCQCNKEYSMLFRLFHYLSSQLLQDFILWGVSQNWSENVLYSISFLQKIHAISSVFWRSLVKQLLSINRIDMLYWRPSVANRPTNCDATITPKLSTKQQWSLSRPQSAWKPPNGKQLLAKYGEVRRSMYLRT